MHSSDPEPRCGDIQEYLARVPTDREWAGREAARCRDLSTDERFDALADLLRLMQELSARQRPIADAGPFPFWKHWGDPSLGRPR